MNLARAALGASRVAKTLTHSGCFYLRNWKPTWCESFVIWSIFVASHCPEYLFLSSKYLSVSFDDGLRLWGVPSPDMTGVQSFFTSLLCVSLFAPSSQAKFHVLNSNLSSSGYIQQLSAAESLGVVHKSKLCSAPGEMKMLSVFLKLMLYFILKGFYKMFISQVYFQPVGDTAHHLPCEWREQIMNSITFYSLSVH